MKRQQLIGEKNLLIIDNNRFQLEKQLLMLREIIFDWFFTSQWIIHQKISRERIILIFPIFPLMIQHLNIFPKYLLMSLEPRKDIFNHEKRFEGRVNRFSIIYVRWKIRTIFLRYYLDAMRRRKNWNACGIFVLTMT